MLLDKIMVLIVSVIATSNSVSKYSGLQAILIGIGVYIVLTIFLNDLYAEGYTWPLPLCVMAHVIWTVYSRFLATKYIVLIITEFFVGTRQFEELLFFVIMIYLCHSRFKLAFGPEYIAYIKYKLTESSEEDDDEEDDEYDDEIPALEDKDYHNCA